MIITSVNLNKKMQSVMVNVNDKTYHLPFAKLRTKPTQLESIESIWIDEELGKQAVTYRLSSGREDSIHLDAFLDYNKDVDYLRKVKLYDLTIRCSEIIQSSEVSKREIARKMSTSVSQLLRLLDINNQTKTIDQMIRLLYCLGASVEFDIRAPKHEANGLSSSIAKKFHYLSSSDIDQIPPSSTFQALLTRKAA